MYYKIPTLILIAPMFLILEVGLWVFAFKNKWLDKQVEVYRYWLKKESWHVWLQKRNHMQHARIISDRLLLKNAVGSIRFQEEMMKNPLLIYIGNPLMELYFTFMKLVLWW